MTLILLSVLPFMVCLFWCVIYLIEYRVLTAAQHVLNLFLGVGAVLYYCHATFFLSGGVVSPMVDIVYAFCNLAVFPLFYLYIRRLTVAKPLTLTDYLALLPSVAVGLWTAGIYLICSRESVPGHQCVRILVGKVIFVIQLVLVLYYGTKRLRHFDYTIDQFYSNKENREVRLFGIIIVAMLVCGLFSTISSYIGREYFSANGMLLAIPSCIFSLLLFTIAYVGHRQTFDADRFLSDELQGDTDTTASALDGVTDLQPAAADNSLLYDRLMQLIIRDKVHLECDIKLTDIADRLHVSRSTLSAYINQTLGTSFSDFINEKRIEHAKNLIKSQPLLALVEVSERSGFASPSSFYRAFKKCVGVTPKEWIAGGK